MSGTAKHGLSYTSEYRAWQTMRLRCLDPKNAAYPNYGERGITVCDRWKDSPENFIADMGERPEGRTLDRYPNKHGDYGPGNCRWATNEEQSRNRRSKVIIVEHDGRRQTLAEWAREIGIHQNTVYSRRRYRGWAVERALGLPGARIVEEAAA